MDYKKTVVLLTILIFCLYNVGCAEPDIKAPNGKILYEKLLSKVVTIYFSDSNIINNYDVTFSTKDKDAFIKLLKEVKNSSWNDIEVHTGTFPYTFLVDDGNGNQYQIHGNFKGEIVFSYDLIYPGTIRKWMKQRKISYLNRYSDVKFLVNKEKMESLIKPYKEELQKMQKKIKAVE